MVSCPPPSGVLAHSGKSFWAFWGPFGARREVFYFIFSPPPDTDVRIWGFQDVAGVRIFVFTNPTDVRK